MADAAADEIPLPKGARTHCRECESPDLKCVEIGGDEYNVKCTCKSCGHFWYLNVPELRALAGS